MQHRSEIEGLRAIAVIMVVVFHTGTTALSGGFIGVDVFFAISGFLITSIVLRDLQAGRFSYHRFYEARARRILPALMVVSAFCVPIACAWMLPTELVSFFKSLVSANTFVSNILFWRESGYFAAEAELKPLLHTWSLAIEMQFYLLYPVFFVCLWRWRENAVGPILLLLCSFSFAYAEWGSQSQPSANFYLLPSRVWELGAGSLLAIANSRGKASYRSEIGALTGLALLLYAALTFGDDTPFPGRWALVPILGTLMIIACSAGTRVGELLSFKPFVAIGLISYSFYLWHQPIFAFARMSSRDALEATDYCFLVGLAAALATVTWRFVEDPLRRRASMPLWMFSSLAGCAAVLLLAVGAAGYFFAKDQAASPLGQKLALNLRGNTGMGDPCDPNITSCATGPNPSIIVWGDSFAMHLVDGIVATTPDKEVVQATKSACGPILDVAALTSKHSRSWAEGCISFNSNVKRFIESQQHLKYAVLSSPFVRYLGENSLTLFEGVEEHRGTRFAFEMFSETLVWLRSRGIEPIVVGPPPSDILSRRNLGTCAARSIWMDVDPSECNLSGEVSMFHQREVHEFLKSIGQNFSVIWPAEYLCEHSSCLVVSNSTPLYRDAIHLSRQGSKWLGERMHLNRRW